MKGRAKEVTQTAERRCSSLAVVQMKDYSGRLYPALKCLAHIYIIYAQRSTEKR